MHGFYTGHFPCSSVDSRAEVCTSRWTGRAIRQKTACCSRWKSVLSGVPQRSVLGLLLFLIYINDLDDNITSNILKFADDTKVFKKVNTDGDKQHLQNDLDKLVKWSEKWHMLLNFGKCKYLHTGHGELGTYTIIWEILFTYYCKRKGLMNNNMC